jgi:TonB family protein
MVVSLRVKVCKGAGGESVHGESAPAVMGGANPGKPGSEPDRGQSPEAKKATLCPVGPRQNTGPGSSSGCSQQHVPAIAPLPYNGPEASRLSDGTASMSQTWKQWQGQVVNGRFPLQKYLGSSDSSIVFLTERGGTRPQKAAIKLIADDPGLAEAQLTLWKQATSLAHPHLLPIFEAGRCEMGGVRLLYVVMECAEENLSEILPQRPLTSAEARDMLRPVLEGLEYLHGKGFVQGRLKPSNILAVADQVKLSGDGLRALSPSGAGPGNLLGSSVSDPPEMANGPITPAADVWSLGATLVEVLTRRRPSWDRTARGATKEPELLLPEGIPDAFLDLARHCLNPDPQKRWTIAEIKSSLDSSSTAAVKPEEVRIRPREEVSSPHSTGRVSSATWLYISIAVVALVLIWLAATRTRHPHRPPEASEAQPAPSPASEPAQVQPESKPSPVVVATDRSPGTQAAAPAAEAQPKPTPSSAVSSPRQSGAPAVSAPARAAKRSPETIPAEVGERVLPQVSTSARNSIRGHVRVSVKVAVDASGNVVESTLDSPGPSKYFARLAREAAGRWKFSPAQVKGRPVPSKWILRFAFSSSGTDVRPTEVAP